MICKALQPRRISALPPSLPTPAQSWTSGGNHGESHGWRASLHAARRSIARGEEVVFSRSRSVSSTRIKCAYIPLPSRFHPPENASLPSPGAHSPSGKILPAPSGSSFARRGDNNSIVFGGRRGSRLQQLQQIVIVALLPGAGRWLLPIHPAALRPPPLPVAAALEGIQESQRAVNRSNAAPRPGVRALRRPNLGHWLAMAALPNCVCLRVAQLQPVGTGQRAPARGRWHLRLHSSSACLRISRPLAGVRVLFLLFPLLLLRRAVRRLIGLATTVALAPTRDRTLRSRPGSWSQTTAAAAAAAAAASSPRGRPVRV
jgi:hypothetical protein